MAPSIPDLDWKILTQEEARRPGAAILALLLDAAAVRGLSAGELAETLGISRAYFNQLRRGENEIPKISVEILTRMARFLKISKFAAMVHAEQLVREDFYSDPEELAASQRLAALRAIQLRHTDNCERPLPLELFTGSASLQSWAIETYEAATGSSFLPVHSDPAETFATQEAILTALRDKSSRKR